MWAFSEAYQQLYKKPETLCTYIAPLLSESLQLSKRCYEAYITESTDIEKVSKLLYLLNYNESLLLSSFVV